MQIDVLRIENNTAVCSLYTGNRCVRIVMHENSYEDLLRDGFFIRDGNKADSAGVINTSLEYGTIINAPVCPTPKKTSTAATTAATSMPRPSRRSRS